jgi:hypothetical protein
LLLILAGYRLSAVHKALPGLDRLADEVTHGIGAEADGYLAWMRVHYGEGAGEQPDDYDMRAAIDELPPVLFGSIIVYLLSVLESTLQACLEITQLAAGRPVKTEVRGAKLEGYLRALAVCGVEVNWDDQTWADLRSGREIRNRFVHELETGPPGGSVPDLGVMTALDLLRLVDTALRDLSRAMQTVPPERPSHSVDPA